MNIRRSLAILAALVMSTMAFALNPPADLTVGLSGSDVVLRWQPVAGATEYNIYKETAEITDVTNLFQYATVNALTFTDNTSGGQQFYYVVTAVVPAGDLTGTINDTSNTAAQGALVYASLQGNPSVFGLAYTDANGNYLVETLPVGTYDVCVYKVNRPVATTTAVITEGGVVNWSYTWPVFTRTLLPLNVSGTLTNDQVYELTGPTSVAPGSVLDIEEGVTINGSSSINADTVNVLTFLEVEASDGVNSNGVMNVNGTKYKPVVFTSGRLTGTPRDGDWGGLIISGDAQNNRGRVAVGEGNTGPFGNALANALNTQSSGTAQYFRLEYGGFRFTATNELNSVCFQAVGSGTDYHHFQAFGGQDDGVEFFGGTNSIHHVVIQNTGDDGFDWTDGWVGKAWNVVVYCRGQFSDKAIEADNLEADNNALPRANGWLSNFTLVGHQGSPAANTDLVNPRRGTLFSWFNFIFTLGGAGGIDMDNSATAAAGAGGLTRIDNSLFWDNGAAATEVIDANTGAGIGDGHFRCEDAEWDNVNGVPAGGMTLNSHILAAPTGWTQNISNFRGTGFSGTNATTLIADPLLVNPTAYDARPAVGSPALVSSNAAPAATLAGYGLPYASYLGAFNGPSDNWHTGWSR
ncbi:MAG: carboxypeptidase regulatory-like domain-containing protein [bacterium]|nr:carboxypeptidase regulatory-like domain-containing protein [bacterium]